METPAATTGKSNLTIIGALLLIVPLYIHITWMVIFESNRSAPQEVKRQLFLDAFPGPTLTDTLLLNIIVLLLAIGALFVSVRARATVTGLWKLINTTVIVLAVLMLALQLFQMM